jgi:hypothetical protein
VICLSAASIPIPSDGGKQLSGPASNVSALGSEALGSLRGETPSFWQPQKIMVMASKPARILVFFIVVCFGFKKRFMAFSSEDYREIPFLQRIMKITGGSIKRGDQHQSEKTVKV